jgi:hypothetical protein
MRVRAGDVAKRRARRRRGEAGDVDVVLDRERNAEERHRAAQRGRVAAAGGTRFERGDLALDAGTVDPRDPHARRAFLLEAPLQCQKRLARRRVAPRCGDPVVNREQRRIGHATVWCALVYRCVYCTKCAGRAGLRRDR